MRLLIADDDRELASALASYLRHCNEAVVSTVTTGGVDVLRNVERFHPDVILMDVMMPRLNGLTICQHILSCRSQTRIILLSGILSATHPLVVQSGATAFVPKPVKLAELRRVVEEVVGRVGGAPPGESAVAKTPSTPPMPGMEDVDSGSLDG